MRWNKEEIEFLKENYSKKIPLEEISKEIGKSRKAISHKAQRLDLSRPWRRFNKPEKIFSRKEIEKRYYIKNKDKIYDKKMKRRKMLKEEGVKILGGKCEICGYNKCLAALEFHHKKDDKDGGVHIFIENASRRNFLKEVNKCILLCANCHRELHHKGSVV